MSRERDEAGRYTDSVALEDVLGVFEAVEGPVVTSGDIADALDCSRETARRKIRALEDRERVANRETAGCVVWWRVDADEVATEFDAGDPLFSGDPLLAPEDPVDETEIDDVLYGEG